MQEGSPLAVDESPGESFQEAPVLTAVIQGTDAITLSWTEIAGASGYELERFDWKEGAYVVIAKLQGAEACAYQDAELSPGVNYIYRVRAYVSGAAFDAYGPYSSVSQLRLSETGETQIPWRVVLPVAGGVLLAAAAAAVTAVLVAGRK